LTKKTHTLCGLALGAILLLPAAGSPQASNSMLIVHMADGSSLPLQSWSLSYEYQAWKQGTAPGFTQPVRRNAALLWVGKKAFPIAGSGVEIQYRVYERQVEVDGQMQKGQGAVVTALVLSVEGKRAELKPEPPAKEFLMPGESAKGLTVQARSLDVRGETLTGTKRDFCVMSYTALVECSAVAANRIVRLEIQR
jgi:hypothetical protein